MKCSKWISILLAAVMLAACVSAAFAEGSQDREAERNAKLHELEIRSARTIDVDVDMWNMLFVMKEVKLYGRKIIGVSEDAEWILGPWELLYHDTYIPATTLFNKYYSGTYAAFAWSADVMWGTDWPYSGVFWNNPDTAVDRIEICMSGDVRAVDCKITVNGKTVVDEEDCDSHKEWKP